MITPISEHVYQCPMQNVGHQIVASITIPDAPGLNKNRYAVVAVDRVLDNGDITYCTWVIAPYMVNPSGPYWSGDQGHYLLNYADALKDMVTRALQG